MAFPAPTLLQTQCCLDKLRAEFDALSAAQPVFGLATLVDGEVDVADTSITADSIVVASHSTISGTAGVLSIVLDPGTGFTIESDSATDDSEISFVVKY